MANEHLHMGGPYTSPCKECTLFQPMCINLKCEGCFQHDRLLAIVHKYQQLENDDAFQMDDPNGSTKTNYMGLWFALVQELEKAGFAPATGAGHQ